MINSTINNKEIQNIKSNTHKYINACKNTRLLKFSIKKMMLLNKLQKVLEHHFKMSEQYNEHSIGKLRAFNSMISIFTTVKQTSPFEYKFTDIYFNNIAREAIINEYDRILNREPSQAK